ncbi:hypothetical protein [Roseomonas marmotae]|uniref:Anti-sigma factor NepR domain-containing protein n=1 Tax=Roseomonas marmotae TaxID=2768161 RepID=A0ABS3KBN3_9PROT|nr:hypothetical protein [Roseomonas marmotae]MBO1074850.1 hypothetical protein [Roseomonas marmotae]QTI80645.1 hypothetical protein IAI58_07940 [Roseomonas marmotae]
MMKRYGRLVTVEQRALDQWTQRALQERYGRTMDDPLPDELLALIQQFPEH